MINQDWWFTTLLIKQFKYCPPLKQDIRCDVLIVGGGFSGVSAAAEFVKKRPQGCPAGEKHPGRKQFRSQRRISLRPTASSN